jgi:hypothetical protein
MRKLITLTLLSLLFGVYTQAQNVTEAIDNQPVMEQQGKIYVVLLVCLVVLGGLIAYLFLIDKRISQIEKEKR